MDAHLAVRYTLRSGNMFSPYDVPLYTHMEKSTYTFYALETLSLQASR